MKCILGIVLSLSLSSAFAANDVSCIPLSKVKNMIEEKDGRLVTLTPEQWEFIRGIYAMNPETPPGLPVGDKAMLAQKDGDEGGIVIFVDKDKACSPMPIPKQLIDLLKDVATGEIKHIGEGL